MQGWAFDPAATRGPQPCAWAGAGEVVRGDAVADGCHNSDNTSSRCVWVEAQGRSFAEAAVLEEGME